MTWLQRHPLIDPMFLLHLCSPLPTTGEGLGVMAVSAPFARGNLHLVISFSSSLRTFFANQSPKGGLLRRYALRNDGIKRPSR